MPRTFRLGTRTSKLALWQAAQVEQALTRLGYSVQRVELESRGDELLDIPLNKFGAPGVFTDKFDGALADNIIDLAVHSLKDYPATTPDGMLVAAHLKRGNPMDTLVLRKPLDRLDPNGEYAIATCSSRRTTQWLSRYPSSTIEPIRGNVPTRLAKLYASEWDGAIFARAGLDRLGLRPPHTIDLGWMIPAPAQAIVAAVCRKDDTEVVEALSQIDDAQTAYVATIERRFLEALGGGCEAPVAGLATMHESQVHFKGYFWNKLNNTHHTFTTTVDRTSSQKVMHAILDAFNAQTGQNAISTIKTEQL